MVADAALIEENTRLKAEVAYLKKLREGVRFFVCGGLVYK